MQTPLLESKLSPGCPHKKSRTDVLLTFDLGSGGRIRTDDLRVMSPTSYHCSTPHSIISHEIGCKNTNFFPFRQIFPENIFLSFDYTSVTNALRSLHLHGICAGGKALK